MYPNLLPFVYATADSGPEYTDSLGILVMSEPNILSQLIGGNGM